MEGNVALIVIILIRTFVPFVILRFPLGGALLAILADASDVMTFERFGSGILDDSIYHNFDKVFDTWYLFFEFLVISKWSNIAVRRTGKTLFIWRFAGFAIFELFGFRPAFFLAPNIFENYYLAVTIIKKYFKSFEINWKRNFLIIILVGLPKIAQEYVMHYKYPDQTWNFLRDHLFWWMY